MRSSSISTAWHCNHCLDISFLDLDFHYHANTITRHDSALHRRIIFYQVGRVWSVRPSPTFVHIQINCSVRFQYPIIFLSGIQAKRLKPCFKPCRKDRKIWIVEFGAGTGIFTRLLPTTEQGVMNRLLSMSLITRLATEEQVLIETQNS
jgi:hypothetical protein